MGLASLVVHYPVHKPLRRVGVNHQTNQSHALSCNRISRQVLGGMSGDAALHFSRTVGLSWRLMELILSLISKLIDGLAEYDFEIVLEGRFTRDIAGDGMASNHCVRWLLSPWYCGNLLRGRF